jgi:hypothetical protein
LCAFLQPLLWVRWPPRPSAHRVFEGEEARVAATRLLTAFLDTAFEGELTVGGKGNADAVVLHPALRVIILSLVDYRHPTQTQASSAPSHLTA